MSIQSQNNGNTMPQCNAMHKGIKAATETTLTYPGILRFLRLEVEQQSTRALMILLRVFGVD